MKKNIKTSIIISLAILFCFFKNEAQQTHHFPNIAYINTDDGLSQSEVTSIIKDKKGFIWVGTRGGLNRYDGSTVKVFQNEIENTNSLINNSIETLFEDSNGGIWIGTKSNGITQYNPKFNKFEQFQSVTYSKGFTLQDKRVIAISESVNNEIWIGTWQSGLYIFNPEKKSFRHVWQNHKINDIVKAKDGNMWLATNNGVFVFSAEGENLERIVLKDNYAEFTSIVEDKDTDLFYFGTWNQGLLIYNTVNKTFKQYKDHDFLNLSNAYYLCQDSKKNILIGTWGNGVHYFNTKTENFINFDLSLGQNKGGKELYKDVLNIFEDDLGVLWFGTNGGGLCKVDESSNQFNDTKSTNLPNEPIWAVSNDKHNNLWVGIKGDKNIFYSENDIEFTKIAIPEIASIRSNSRKDGIRAIYRDHDNSIWVANNSSLFEVQKTEDNHHVIPIKIHYDKTSKSDYLDKIRTIYQTKDGTFWLGTQQRGLRKSIGPGNPKNQSFKTYLNNERISCFLEDKRGRFWIGTYRGLKLYNPKSDSFSSYFKIQGNSQTLSSDIIICMFQDKKGTLWVGTPNGLNQISESQDGTLTFNSFQEKDGLANSYIHSILEDEQGNLWLSTNKGLSKYNTIDNSFFNYDINSGLLSNTFMEGVAIKGQDGKLYFGSIYGLNIFKPDAIKNSNVPPVILTGLKVSGQNIYPNKEYDGKIILNEAIEYNPEITLTPNNNSFSLEYTALDFQSNFGYSYKYKMEGLDRDWNTTTSQKNITYSYLKDGDYIFKVKATNNEEDLDSKIASLKIKVLPVFWKTWQAFIIYILTFVGLLYLYRYFITKQSELKNKLALSNFERKKEEELIEIKTRFFTDIAHEFRTPLSLISGPVEVMMDDKVGAEQKKGHLATIYYHTQRLLNLVNQLLDFRKIESGNMTLQVANGNFKKFSHEIFLSFKELAESKNINFKFKVKGTEIPLTYDRNRMEIVLCNLLSNAFKYSPEGSEIILSIQNIKPEKNHANFPYGYCEISVKDNGQGIAKDALEPIFDRFYQISNTKSSNLIGTGIGLALVKQIVELHKGDILVESEVGKGSEFIVRLALGESHFSKEEFIEDFKRAEDPVHYKVERVLKEETNPKSKNDDDLKTLLIAEDNPEIRSFIKTIFKNTYIVIEAENGKIGLEKAIKDHPDIIITDLIMPEMDGLALCKHLRETKETMHIPVIMLTARTKTVFQEEGYSSGADIYVTKPFNPAVLKAQAEGLLNTRMQLKDYFSKKITLQPTDSDNMSFDEKFLNKAMKIVEDNLMNENLNRDFIANNMSISPSTLYRKIKSLTGQDTTVFIRSIRLKRAAQMLQNKQDNVGSIGYGVGFNDLKYFRKCFKEQFGVSPSKFAKD